MILWTDYSRLDGALYALRWLEEHVQGDIHSYNFSLCSLSALSISSQPSIRAPSGTCPRYKQWVSLCTDLSMPYWPKSVTAAKPRVLAGKCRKVIVILSSYRPEMEV